MTTIKMMSKGLLLLLVLSLTVGCATTNTGKEGAHARAQKGQTTDMNGGGDGFDNDRPEGVQMPLSQLPGFSGSGMCDTIHFDYDKANIKAEYVECLNSIAAYMIANTQYTLIAEGHADERGTDEYNLALGESRAESAMQHLLDRGLDADRVVIRSWGEEKPVAMCHNESCWWQNRRVEFYAVNNAR